MPYSWTFTGAPDSQTAKGTFQVKSITFFRAEWWPNIKAKGQKGGISQDLAMIHGD
jgi:hypothetical protein